MHWLLHSECSSRIGSVGSLLGQVGRLDGLTGAAVYAVCHCCCVLVNVVSWLPT
jgi:hypothetical protein